MAIEKQLLGGFAAAIGVERSPVESLWSLYNHVRLVNANYFSGCHKKKMRKPLFIFIDIWSDALKSSSSIIL